MMACVRGCQTFVNAFVLCHGAYASFKHSVERTFQKGGAPEKKQKVYA
jgi:hypothetical protein